SDSAATAEISLSDTVLSAKGHTLTHVEAQGATCTADGNSEYWYCTECGKYFSDSAATAEISLSDTVLSATGHSMTHYEAVDVSCTTDGNIEYWYCANCDKYFSDEDGNSEITDTSTITIAATGHNYVDTVTDPTCTEQGYTTHTCDNCGESYVDTYVEATGHSYGTPVWTWESDYSTCTATFTCDKGDDTQILTATVTSATTDATCTTDGEIAYTSTVTFNGNEYTDTQTEAIAATGHTYGEPVFTWNGNTCTATFTCTECDDTQTVDATVTSKNFFGMVTRTAEVTFEGLTYTDTKTTGRSLLTIMADYTSVNNAIAKANALNASDYSNFADVTAAINAVQWNLNVLNQSTVNGYAEAIETAIANLKAAELTEETVTINEPIEDTNTETEPDDIEVDDTDEETNPTTGIALAMLPMAIALAATVANKRG
ncbi:MAG: hypothetical protein LUH56_03130, partial [Oscillospiraceae bacterium]|nr:hypothetical protein [Oscillospiraceae bacterium]